MKAVIDANYFINKEFPVQDINEGYIPSSVEQELKDKLTKEFYELYSFKISVRDPKEEYITEVQESIKDKHFGLSLADIDVVALTLELSDEIESVWIDEHNMNSSQKLLCLTKDNGIKSALVALNLYNDPDFQARKFKLRCFTCYTTYDTKVDFCRKCGYNTLTRVTVLGKGPNEVICLKANYKFKPKVLKDERGIILQSADQREYIQYKEKQLRNNRKNNS